MKHRAAAPNEAVTSFLYLTYLTLPTILALPNLPHPNDYQNFDKFGTIVRALLLI